jgi:hypothetical protein
MMRDLQKLSEAPEGSSRVDVLIRVAMCDGGSQTLYLHLEVQSSKEDEAYRLIASMMRLPTPQALLFRKQLVDFQKENNRPYLIDTEEIAIWCL